MNLHSVRSGLATLTARYDTAVLQPPPATLPWPPAATETFAALRDWCLAGAVPRRTKPFRIASLTGNESAVRELALQLCWERDGSQQMQNLGRIGRMALRLGTQVRDVLDAAPRASDPWDAGCLIADAPGLRALSAFVPRRPTLIVLEDPSAATQETVRLVLARRCAAGSRPVRLLVTGLAPVATEGEDWQRFSVD